MTHLYFSNLKSPKSSLLFSSFSIIPLGYLGCWRNSSSDPRLWCWWVGVHGLKNTVILRSLWTSTSPKTGILQILFRSVAVPSSANWSGILTKKHREEDHWVCHMNHLFIWMFPENNGVFPPTSSILIRFSMIFTIHYMGYISPYFRKHPIWFPLAVWPGDINSNQVMTMPLVWQLGCQDLEGDVEVGMDFSHGFWGCTWMTGWVATQIFGFFSPLPFVGKMNPIWRAYFSKGLVQPPIRWVWMIFVLTTSGGSGLGRWIFEGSRKDLIKLLLISLSLKWKRKPHKQVLCVWVWCLYWCPAILQWGCLTPGGFFINIYWCSKKHHVQAHTQLRWYFLKKLKFLNPPPPQKKPTLLGTNISYPKALLKMIFLFPKLDMLVPWRVLLEGTFPTFSPLSSPFFKKS